MNTSVKYKPAKAIQIRFFETKLCGLLEDGREIGVPPEWFPELRDASEEGLRNWRFIGNGVGIHWEALYEDLSIETLIH